jgi:hypothetical protein
MEQRIAHPGKPSCYKRRSEIRVQRHLPTKNGKDRLAPTRYNIIIRILPASIGSQTAPIRPLIDKDAVDKGGAPSTVTPEMTGQASGGNSSLWSDEPWVVAPNEFSAPLASRNAFPGLAAADEGRSPADTGFLGKAVGKIHENLKYWEETLDHDSYVTNILKYSYKIPVIMTAEQKVTVYREGNNKSACSEMDFVRSEVGRLVTNGQVIEVKAPVTCTNPLTVAFKVNSNGTIKRRLVIDLSRWVNPMIVPDKFRMSRFQDALAQSSRGDYQSVFDVS